MEDFVADTDYWTGSVQWEFTVKSAYELRCGATVCDDGKLWQTIHNYKGLQRIKIFLWLACLGRVLTNSERVRRHLAENANCIVCGALVEDVNHVVRWCPQAIGAWSSVIKLSFLSRFLSMDFKEWVHMNLSDAARMVSNPDNWDLLFGAICWNLWLGRNAVVFDNPLEDRGTVLERSRRLVERCLMAFGTAAPELVVQMRNGATGCTATELKLQQCMAEGWFFANSDAGCRIEDGSATCGGVIRNHEGRWVRGITKFIGVCSALEAEAWGAYMILLVARNLGINRIVLLLDCMEVVRLANLEYLPPGALTIMMYFREILSYDWCIEVHHIDRKRNRLAHDLAKLADGSSLCPIHFPHPPDSFVMSDYANGIG
ncbi:hypothetical protein GQ457_03G021160 [Hibiscus cannabinus]